MYTRHLCQLHCFLIPCFHRSKWESSLIYVGKSKLSLQRIDMPVCMPCEIKYVCIFTIHSNTNTRGQESMRSRVTLCHISFSISHKRT